VLDGRLLVDAHVHVARLPTLSADWQSWVATFGSGIPVGELFDASGVPRPAALDAYFAAEGADHVLLFSEYSPKSTGIQPIEDVLPVVAQNPARFRPVANINPHLHYPVKAELARQVDLGAVACKIHPVHGGFEPADRMLYPVYALCEELSLPVIVHCGTSTFAGSVNAYGEPALLDPVLRDFPELTVVLAHGGRGWWYDQAAFLALMRPNTWLEVAGLPPARLPDYYGRSLVRLARKMVFGTDWPGVPGVQRNARGLEKVLLESGCTQDEVTLALGGNAAQIFGLSDDQRSLT
jgi:predicted TIM-barrel fold metal-dependent hydrolase